MTSTDMHTLVIHVEYQCYRDYEMLSPTSVKENNRLVSVPEYYYKAFYMSILDCSRLFAGLHVSCLVHPL